MQKTIKGDDLLAEDLALYELLGEGEAYLAYPSREIPRFIAPRGDEAALRFLFTILSADKGIFGALLRGLLTVPLVPRLLALITFEPLALKSRSENAEVSFVEKVRRFVEERRQSLPRAVGKLRITKFCQRIAGPDTKILFLITDEKSLLAIVKTMRSTPFDGKLKREKAALEELAEAGIKIAPRVYFEGEIGDRYVYAEEVIEGVPISRRHALRKEREIVETIASFPTYGSISALEVAKIFARNAPEDANFAAMLSVVRSSDVFFRFGLTHSDLGRVNILASGETLHIVDWGSAKERPFRLIDAVYLLLRLHNIRSMEEWESRGVPLLVEYSRVDREVARGLYALWILFEILHKKYPDLYRASVEQFQGSIEVAAI